jgi:hypothetical protein
MISESGNPDFDPLGVLYLFSLFQLFVACLVPSSSCYLERHISDAMANSSRSNEKVSNSQCIHDGARKVLGAAIEK